MTMRPSKRLDPIHPGEILLEDFMKPLRISINKLARDLDVPPNRIGAIANGTRAITDDTALRLGASDLTGPSAIRSASQRSGLLATLSSLTEGDRGAGRLR
jgi:addiction module HigA family antidote